MHIIAHVPFSGHVPLIVFALSDQSQCSSYRAKSRICSRREKKESPKADVDVTRTPKPESWKTHYIRLF